MDKLTPALLLLIFFIDIFPARAEEGAVEPMADTALLARSYQPDIAYRILLRSTGRSHSKALPGREADRYAPSGRPDVVKWPALILPPPSPDRKRIPPPSAPSKLDARVIGRLGKYRDPILRYSRMNGVDPNLIRAIIYVESSGDPKAVSPKGARGLMQLMPATASDMGVSNSFDPAQNIFGGTRYLKGLFNRFERPDLVLWAYNAGPEAVKRKRLPAETKRYIPEVLRVKSVLDRAGF